MMQLYMVLIIAVIATVCALFRVNPIMVVMEARQAYASRALTIKGLSRKYGKRKKNAVEKLLEQALKILDDTGRGEKKEAFYTVSTICIFAGLVIGITVGNLYLAAVLAAAGFLLPFLYILFTEQTYEKRLNRTLYASLNSANETFVKSGGILLAIGHDVENMMSPAKEVVGQCIGEIRYLGVNQEDAIRHMRGKINNTVFHQWCDALIRCLRDPSLYGQLKCIEDLQDQDNIQQMLEAKVHSTIFMSFFFMIVSIFIGPFLAVSFPLIGQTFFQSVVGQVCVALIAGLNIATLIRCARVSRPIKLIEEGDDA